MMTRPSTQALRAIHVLSQSSGWSDIKAFFDEELLRTYELMSSHQDEVKLRQFQGRAQFVREFLDIVRDAKVNLEKLRESTL